MRFSFVFFLAQQNRINDILILNVLNAFLALGLQFTYKCKYKYFKLFVKEVSNSLKNDSQYEPSNNKR